MGKEARRNKRDKATETENGMKPRGAEGAVAK